MMELSYGLFLKAPLLKRARGMMVSTVDCSLENHAQRPAPVDTSSAVFCNDVMPTVEGLLDNSFNSHNTATLELHVKLAG